MQRTVNKILLRYAESTRYHKDEEIHRKYKRKYDDVTTTKYFTSAIDTDRKRRQYEF